MTGVLGRLQVAGSLRNCLGSGGYLARGLTKVAGLLNLAGAVNLGPGAVPGGAANVGTHTSAGGAAHLAIVCMTATLGGIVNNDASIGPLDSASAGICRGPVFNISGDNLGVSQGVYDTPLDSVG